MSHDTGVQNQPSDQLFVIKLSPTPPYKLVENGSTMAACGEDLWLSEVSWRKP